MARTSIHASIVPRADHGRLSSATAASTGSYARLNMAALEPVLLPTLPPTPPARSASASASASPEDRHLALAGIPLHECQMTVFGRSATIGAVGAGPQVLEEACERLIELGRLWRSTGPDSELAQLRSRPGVALRVSQDTLALAEVDARRRWKSRSFYIDGAHQTVGLLTDSPLGLDDLAAALATDLVFISLSKFMPAGAYVRIGMNHRAMGASPRGGGWAVDGEPKLRIQRGGLSIIEESGQGPFRRRVAVVADQAWRAHVLAGKALTLTDSRAKDLLAQRCPAARITTKASKQIIIGAWDSWLTKYDGPCESLPTGRKFLPFHAPASGVC